MFRSRIHCGCKSGFTLIELLVVIAIISLLAAILFPVFSRARENARRASCLSNTRQIGIAVQMYSQDYDEVMVPYYTLQPSHHGWNEKLQAYIKSTQVFTCPAHRKVKNCDPKNVTATLGSGSFGFNGFVSGAKLAAIANPAATIVTTEITGLISVTYSYQPSTWTYSRTAAQTASCYNTPAIIGEGFATRHFDGNNIAFTDGHVKWMTKAAVRDSDGNGTADDGLWDLN